MLVGEQIKLRENEKMGCNWDESGIIPGSERDLIGIKLGSPDDEKSR